MFEGAPLPPPRLFRTSEAGRFLGLSGRTLEEHRREGCTGVVAFQAKAPGMNWHEPLDAPWPHSQPLVLPER